MATSPDFIEFVCGQLSSPFELSYRKMFGEYMVYHWGRSRTLGAVCVQYRVRCIHTITDAVRRQKEKPHRGSGRAFSFVLI